MCETTSAGCDSFQIVNDGRHLSNIAHTADKPDAARCPRLFYLGHVLIAAADDPPCQIKAESPVPYGHNHADYLTTWHP
jgi:hypothetical protein